MAIIKHIAVKNRYYSAAVEYLTCKFDEHTMKPLVDDKGRIMLRDSFLIEGINCEVDTLGAEYIETNRYYGKNNAARDVKAHHYIISFSPDDHITMQGCKHKSTEKFMRAAKQWVIRECMVKGCN